MYAVRKDLQSLTVDIVALQIRQHRTTLGDDELHLSPSHHMYNICGFIENHQ